MGEWQRSSVVSPATIVAAGGGLCPTRAHQVA